MGLKGPGAPGKNRRHVLLRVLLFLCLLSVAYGEGDKFKIVPVNISIHDKFARPYLVEDNTTKLGARLVPDDKQNNFDVKNYETLSWAGIDYPRNSSEYVKWPVQNGTAKVQFVVLTENNTPVDYELVLIDQNNVVHALQPSVWKVGVESTQGEVHAEDLRAPHAASEIAITAAFAFGSVIFSYWLLGRRLFTRMLRNRNMEVGAALGWSNMALIVAWGLAAIAVAVMIFFPVIVWQKLYWIYVLVPAVYAAIVGLLFAFGQLLTRA
jgi:hypothetical protein